MVNGSIVSIINQDDKLFYIKGFIINCAGNNVAILEELCNNAHIKLIEENLLRLIWNPERLIDEIKEYELLDNDADFLITTK